MNESRREKVVNKKVWEMGEVDFFVISRWILILLVLFLIGYNSSRFEYLGIAYRIAIAYVVFNLIIRFRIFHFLQQEKFLFVLFLFDIGFVSLALYLSRGIEQNFFIIYLLTIVMAAMSSGLRSSFPVAILTAVLYTWIGWSTKGITNFDDPAFLLRIPFLFLIAFMSGAWADMMRKKIERKEQALKEEILRMKNFYERIINSVNAGIIVVGSDGTVRLENPEVKRLYSKGISRHEIISMVVKEGDERRVEKIKGRYIEFIISHTNNGDDKHLIIGIVKDITRIREMEEELEHSRRLADIGRMASYIAHEVRNPLGVIKGISQIIKMKFRNEKLDELMGKILEGVDRIDRIIEDTLDFARKKPLEIEMIDLRSLMSEILRSIPVKKKVLLKSAKIYLSVSSDNVSVAGDRVSLQRVFENLIMNGLDAIDKGGYLKIQIKKTERNTVVVDVMDNGCGIDEEIIGRIFEPFFTRKKHGTGLGLSVVKKIVQNHGGEIMVKSEKGRGTVFTVVLPVYKKIKTKEVYYESIDSGR